MHLLTAHIAHIALTIQNKYNIKYGITQLYYNYTIILQLYRIFYPTVTLNYWHVHLEITFVHPFTKIKVHLGCKFGENPLTTFHQIVDNIFTKVADYYIFKILHE